MSEYQFIVAPIDGFWIVSSNAGLRVSYDDRPQAIRAAVEAAHASGREGHQAQVVAVDGKNQFYPLWTYGRDAFA